ncbi:MAG: glycoside hydrolase family 36 protein [Promethearchaeati archaeon]
MLKISQDNEDLIDLKNRNLHFEYFKTGEKKGRFNIKFQDFDGTLCCLKNCYCSINYFKNGTNILEEYPSYLFNFVSTIEDIHDKNGEGLNITFSRKFPEENKFDFKLLVKIYDENDFILLTLIDLKDLSENSHKIHSISPLTIKNEKLWLTGNNSPTNLRNITWFKNGWQSWSPCKLFFGEEKDRKGPPLKVFKRTLDNQDYEIEGRFYSEYNTVITEKDSNNSLLLGFTTLNNQFSRVILDYKNYNNLKLLTAFSCMDGVNFHDSTIDSSEELFLTIKTKNLAYYGLIDYAKIVKNHIQEERINEIPIGWCSWYYYFTDISEEEMIKNFEIFKKNKDTFPIDFIQLDDGYFTKIGDYKEINDKFPHGLSWLFKKLKRAGFKGGLWTAPFLAEKDSNLLQTHKDWFLTKKGKDKLLKIHFNWGKFEYGLDLSKKEVLDYLKEDFKNFLYALEDPSKTDDSIVDYFKIDFLHAATPYDADYKDKSLTRAQRYYNGIKAIRDGITNDSYLLGCGAPLGPCVGLVDAMRIGTDTAPKWKNLDWIGDKLGFSLSSLKRALINVLYRSYMHTYFWINDPDCLMIRRNDTDLNLNEIQLQLTLFGLSGGQILISDDMTKLSEEEIKNAKLVLPPYNSELTDPILTDAFISKLPTIYFLESQEYFGKRYLSAIINWEDNMIIKSISVSKIIPNLLKDEKSFFIFDFWNQQFLGEVKRNQKIDLEIPSHHCAYLSIIYTNELIKEEPILISSNLHISQGCYEITDFDYEEEEDMITIIIDLIGEREGDVFIRLPPEKVISGCECPFSLFDKINNIWKVRVSFIDNTSLKISLS